MRNGSGISWRIRALIGHMSMGRLSLCDTTLPHNVRGRATLSSWRALTPATFASPTHGGRTTWLILKVGGSPSDLVSHGPRPNRGGRSGLNSLRKTGKSKVLESSPRARHDLILV